MKICCFERIRSLLLKIFKPFSTTKKEGEDINLKKIFNQDDGLTGESIMVHSNVVSEV